MGRRYVRYVNDRYCRTETLWEGRYKASLVGNDRHVLQCQRCIELNPLRAKMVADPPDYRWSSFRHHALGEPNPMITPHPAMAGLGRTPHERRQNYREWSWKPSIPKKPPPPTATRSTSTSTAPITSVE
ncbi:MAG: transposase [Rhodanobacteraceae bacterium]